MLHIFCRLHSTNNTHWLETHLSLISSWTPYQLIASNINTMYLRKPFTESTLSEVSYLARGWALSSGIPFRVFQKMSFFYLKIKNQIFTELETFSFPVKVRKKLIINYRIERCTVLSAFSICKQYGLFEKCNTKNCEICLTIYLPSYVHYTWMTY